jgi:hypothetical protein
MLKWLFKKLSSKKRISFNENIHWCYSRCDSVVHSNIETSCNITAYISAPEINQAFTKMINMAKVQYPELCNKTIYPEESYNIYCKKSGYFFADSPIDELLIDIVDVEWD